MSDNLKDAAESGFRIYGEKIQAPFSNEDLTDLLEAYTSRILASQQAAHDAEIAKLKEELATAKWHEKQTVALADKFYTQLSSANERIAYLEGLVAVKDDALEAMVNHYTELVNSGDAGDWNPEKEQVVIDSRKALSASAETVQAFRDKLTEPLRREIAVMFDLLKRMATYPANGAWTSTEVLAVVADLPATAQAYEQEVEARGAIKALEEVRSRSKSWHEYPEVITSILGELLRATSKKAG